MKLRLLLLSIAIASVGVFAGCNELPDINITDGDPTVAVEQDGDATRNSFAVKFTPNEDIFSWEYVCTLDGEREDFVNGSMEGIVNVDNSEEATIRFTGKDPQKTYTVYARGFDEEGNAGPVAQLLVRTMPNWAESTDLEATKVYTTNNSIGFLLTGTLHFYKFQYALGSAADREAFENGTMQGIKECPEMTEYTANFFDLQPDTDYVFYYRAYDRANTPTEAYSIEVKTNANGAGPEVAFAVKSIDVYKGEFTFQANSHCPMYVYAVSPVGGTFDLALDTPFAAHGNVGEVLDNFMLSGLAFRVNGQDEQNFVNYTPPMDDPSGVLATYYPPALLAGVEFYAYVGMYDINGNYVGSQRYRYSTPEYDESLTPAIVTATATNLTQIGATLKFTAGAGTLGFLFDTIDADTYDEAVATGKWKWNDGTEEVYTENFLRDMFFSRPDVGQGYYWRYCKDSAPADFVDQSMAPGTRFYIAVCPMNANGVSDPNWGQLWVSAAYTTPSE